MEKLRPGMLVTMNDRPARLVEVIIGRHPVDAAIIRYLDEKEARVVPLAKVEAAE